MALGTRSNQTLVVGLAAAATASLLLYYVVQARTRPTSDSSPRDTTDRKSRSVEFTTPSPKKTSGPLTKAVGKGEAADGSEDQTPIVKNTAKDAEKEVNAKIELLDKKGKDLFKNKQYLDAAETFTEALTLIETSDTSGSVQNTSSSLHRQLITLLNNRSAMYEKGNQPELALEDCTQILDQDVHHAKARTRKLRVLESLGRWHDALVEVCAVQLLFMRKHRDSMRLGLKVPPPPVPESKMQEILTNVVPLEMEPYIQALNEKTTRPLPSGYTILQLLRSFTSYNSWMAQAAKDGNVANIDKELVEGVDAASKAQRVHVLLKRGRRHVYDRAFENASDDFEQAYALAETNEVQLLLEGDDYARVLEWTGMVKHWRYKLDEASACYEKCADLEPTNALVLVKNAGVKMDGSHQDEAMKLFDTALGLDPKNADALLHRANLRLLQTKPDEAKEDLEACIAVRPDHIMARLRLASILAATNEAAKAKKHLDAAEKVEPKSSEVQSYRGELHFTQGEFDQARAQFEKAIALDPTNPTPYVNAAMAILQTPPPPGQMPDAQEVIRLLEEAIRVDPSFTLAYTHLGNVKLGTATELSSAREVVTLYDQALANCRSEEEIKELCSMRILAVAQVEAASMLKMESFNMQ
ncbi:predicted protein [Phaeodactylum tricornutum CCAP 1055/1]|jgi:import receptor subunit TOM70|uniref:Ancillary SecYEG translocon subunit/Cell division coordinator CpoB TPR domain-containing protein n=2 Tax=Phaeodactylum tricornutum TaxID=2850 RepID=B7G3J4_PHATC|nr:predicted protein [Phaeodactylum tricornutum CCAP 1055/1]EEC46839.1 predicted protein [Phaeodactylum tricornutum CCAP 1055/1]|eukprot:XP_002181625.1 predicted protein [Phaeodactylum tricornutum CCAP 1055/1]